MSHLADARLIGHVIEVKSGSCGPADWVPVQVLEYDICAQTHKIKSMVLNSVRWISLREADWRFKFDGTCNRIVRRCHNCQTHVITDHRFMLKKKKK